MKNLCVFCGSSPTVPDVFLEAGAEMGRVMAENKYRLIYGGGKRGVMGAMAKAVIDNGGEVTGIIPEHLKIRERAYADCTDLIVVPTMHERKAMMYEKADAFAVLPGGFGTLDETFETITWVQLGLHDKPLVFVNVESFFSPIAALADNLTENRFASAADREILKFADTPEDALSLVKKILT